MHEHFHDCPSGRIDRNMRPADRLNIEFERQCGRLADSRILRRRVLWRRDRPGASLDDLLSHIYLDFDQARRRQIRTAHDINPSSTAESGDFGCRDAGDDRNRARGPDKAAATDDLARRRTGRRGNLYLDLVAV